MANQKLYDFDTEEKKEQKSKKRKEKQIEKLKEKNDKKYHRNKKKNNQQPSNQTYADNEIIIGVTVHPQSTKKTEEEHKKIKQNKSSNKKKQPQKMQEKIMTTSPMKEERKKGKKVVSKRQSQQQILRQNQEGYVPRKKQFASFFKWTSLAIVIVGGIVFAMVSPIFEIRQITVTGNHELDANKIISMSELEIGQNVFRIHPSQISKKIKQNGFVETVFVNRHLPDTIEIVVEERIPTFQISFGNGYVWINNQGYMIKISEEKREIPILYGTVTPEEDYQEKNRLVEEDLEKMNTVLKIMSAAKSNEIETLISSIDISDTSNYQVSFESEQKVAYFGDCSNTEERILWAKQMLEKASGKAGEMIIVNKDKPYFREKIQ